MSVFGSHEGTSHRHVRVRLEHAAWETRLFARDQIDPDAACYRDATEAYRDAVRRATKMRRERDDVAADAAEVEAVGWRRELTRRILAKQEAERTDGS